MNDSKSAKISSTFLNILASTKYTIVCTVSVQPQIFKLILTFLAQFQVHLLVMNMFLSFIFLISISFQAKSWYMSNFLLCFLRCMYLFQCFFQFFIFERSLFIFTNYSSISMCFFWPARISFQKLFASVMSVLHFNSFHHINLGIISSRLRMCNFVCLGKFVCNF